MEIDGLMSSFGATPKAEGTPVGPGRAEAPATGIWQHCRSFLAHVIMVILVGLFMRFYVDGHQFFLSHDLSLQQASGTITHERTLLPVQRDITTIISLLASTARAASTLWLAGIDLRCIFLFMKRGGVSFDGLQSMFGKSIPGPRQFRQRTNLIILLVLHGAILASTYTSSILAGSVNWKASRLYRAGQPVTGIPLGQTGDEISYKQILTLIDGFVAYSTAIYSIFYGNAENRNSTSMHRLVPDPVGDLPTGSRFDELTIPYFAVDKFEWITDPNSTLSADQKTALARNSTTGLSGPRLMSVVKWGLIPDTNWGPPSNPTFSAPHTVSESRILVIWTPTQVLPCHFDPDVPSDVQHITTPSACFIFANVTYRAGAARCRQCQMLSGKGAIHDVGDFKDLTLVDDSVTRAALDVAPYVGTVLVHTSYAVPLAPTFPTLEKKSIEMLSRSYQVAWNGLTSKDGKAYQGTKVWIAVDASTASVLMWRVGLWGGLHTLLVSFGFIFRYIHTRGHHPWIADPVIAALLIDPTPLMRDQRTWAGEDPPHIAGMLKLEQAGESTYLVIEDAKGEKE